MRRLPARLCPRPRVLFVGINPSLRSAAVGHHFAGLPAMRLALTNICARPTRAAAELTPAEFAAGRVALARLIARVKPDVVAFVGVTVYRAFFGPRVAPGAGPKPERIGNARVFVVPNPSGLNAAYPGFADKLIWFRRLKRFAAG